MIKKALLLASVFRVPNQTPVRAETYVEPYSHVTIEISEDYVSRNDSFSFIELNGKYIQLPCKASLIFNLGFAPEEDMRTPEEVFDYPYYDEVGLFSLIGDGYESSIPVKLPTLAVVILIVGVTGGICRVLWRHRRQKRTQEIINTPLDVLADSVLKKYGEEDDE